MPANEESPFSALPKRRREDVALAERLAVVEAVQSEHKYLLDRVVDALQSLARIEQENSERKRKVDNHESDIEKIKSEMPTLRIVRMLVFTAAVSLLGTSILVVWNVYRDTVRNYANKSAGHIEQRTDSGSID
jgi:cell division protein FtsX